MQSFTQLTGSGIQFMMPRRKAKSIYARSEEVLPAGQVLNPESVSHPAAKRQKKATRPSEIQVDYEKLAAEILRQQQAKTSEPQSPSNIHVPADQMSNLSTSNQQNMEQPVATVSNPMMENSGLASLVSSVFSGEPASSMNAGSLESESNSHLTLKDGIPLSAAVSQKIKQKIWNNEFIEMRSLLSPHVEDPITLNIGQGTIRVNQIPKAKTNVSIEQWSDAFLIFICVYIEKHTGQAANLLKYMAMIRELSHIHGDQAWRTYDESFRRLKQTMDIPWQKPVDEFRLKAATISNNKFQRSQSFQAKNNGKVCFLYNRGEKRNTISATMPMSVPTVKAHIPELNAVMQNSSPVNIKDFDPKSPIPLQISHQDFPQGNKLPTPVKVQNLDMILEGYDVKLRRDLVLGFKYGFDLGCSITPNIPFAKNHGSTAVHSSVIKSYIAKGKSKGRIAGPFDDPPFHNFITSPLGVVPKGETGKYRVIHDLSFPQGQSVNASIPKEKSQVEYDSIDNIVDLVQKFGRNALMAKSDIEDAFRIVPLRPENYHLLGFSREGQFFFDKCLPMGASSSCQIFETLSKAIQWVMCEKYKAAGMSHILDDFFFIGPGNSSKCKEDLCNFLFLCEKLGIPVKEEKTVEPTTCITIYGIEVDSTAYVCRLPDDKVQKVRTKIRDVKCRKKVQLRDLQSLIGLLNFACLVVVQDELFLEGL